MGIASPKGVVAIRVDQIGHAFILAFFAAAVQGLDANNALKRRTVFIVLNQADSRPSRMTRHSHPAHARHFVNQLLSPQPDIGEVEALQHGVIDPIHQHVTVLGFDLRGFEDQQAILIFKRPVVAPGVELAVFGQHEAVQRPFVAFTGQPLEVCLNRRAAVVRGFRMQVKVNDSCHRKKAP